MPRIHHLYISSAHNYFGHHDEAAGQAPVLEMKQVECVAGRGIRGDRFFDFKQNYKGQITFFSAEVYREMLAEFGVSETEKPPAVFRRNVILGGVDLHDWIGATFALGGVEFRGTGECAPCHWMDQAFGLGAERWLQGRGGLRAQILTSGVLTAG